MLVVGGAALLTLAVVIAAGVGYFTLNREAPLDARMCPAQGPLGHYVVLVDTTDPLSFTQKQAYSVLFRELIERNTPEGYLLSVFVLGENFEANAKPVVELCNPGSGAHKSELTATLHRLRRQYEERFLKPLLAEADRLASTESAKASPVLEMLQLVALNGFRKENIQGERRLILVSDMLHNTPQFSMYRGTPDYKAFSESTYGQKTRLDLPNTKVELHYLMNAPKLQTRQNLQFWEEHFNKAGARIVAVRPMEG
jgi:hypothetical protein